MLKFGVLSLLKFSPAMQKARSLAASAATIAERGVGFLPISANRLTLETYWNERKFS